MTEQTAAERERRAAILRAEGDKRSAILRAEGERQSMILQAEGERQSKVLRAEGERLSKILQAQGEAQGLRILSLGSRPLDKKAITVLSLDALKQMSDGQATKIIFPFEVSSLIKQSARFLGATEEMPEEEGAAEAGEIDASILGEVPKPEEVAKLLERLEEKLENEGESIEELKTGKKETL
jgi:regulator of protease activity HflC (stomatin/prohibitin superfamily)